MQTVLIGRQRHPLGGPLGREVANAPWMRKRRKSSAETSLVDDAKSERPSQTSGVVAIHERSRSFGNTSRMGDASRLIDSVRGFLSAPRCAVLSTLGPDGAPRQVVIHYMLGNDHIRLNGQRDRRWVANLRRDPRVALIVHDELDYLHYVSIRGRAAVDEHADALTEAMTQATRYGEDPAGFAGQPRVSFRVEPEHVHEYP